MPLELRGLIETLPAQAKLSPSPVLARIGIGAVFIADGRQIGQADIDGEELGVKGNFASQVVEIEGSIGDDQLADDDAGKFDGVAGVGGGGLVPVRRLAKLKVPSGL